MFFRKLIPISLQAKVADYGMGLLTRAAQYTWYQKLASAIEYKYGAWADFYEWLETKRFGMFLFATVSMALILQIVALTYWGPIERFYAVYNFDVTPPLFLEVMVSVILVYLESKIVLPGTVFVLEYLDND